MTIHPIDSPPHLVFETYLSSFTSDLESGVDPEWLVAFTHNARGAYSPTNQRAILDALALAKTRYQQNQWMNPNA